MPGGHPCSKIVAQERHSWVIQQMALCRPRPEIARELRQREGLSRSQALRYLQRADLERCEVYSSADRAALLAQCLAGCEKALQMAIARGLPLEIVASIRTLDNLLALGASHQLQQNRPWENR
jgi:hypothetical protein